MDRETGPETKTGQTPTVEAPEQAREPAGLTSRVNIASITADPRMFSWILRAAMAIVAGTAVGIWLQDWRLGLTAAVLVAIADTILRSKTGSHIPAAALATSAQRRTRRQLHSLRRAGYLALNARAIPGSDQVIDHLVIGPAGVFALDSERWDRRLPVRTVAGNMLYHGPYSQKERLRHARWEAGRASALVGAELGQELSVRPVMVIYGPTIPWVVASLRGVDVFAGSRVTSYFRRQAKASRQQRLDAEQIEAIREAAARVLPPAR
jgi:Nuclease-related domain